MYNKVLYKKLGRKTDRVSEWDREASSNHKVEIIHTQIERDRNYTVTDRYMEMYKICMYDSNVSTTSRIYNI